MNGVQMNKNKILEWKKNLLSCHEQKGTTKIKC